METELCVLTSDHTHTHTQWLRAQQRGTAAALSSRLSAMGGARRAVWKLGGNYPLEKWRALQQTWCLILTISVASPIKDTL